jgi:hypothetical protein
VQLALLELWAKLIGDELDTPCVVLPELRQEPCWDGDLLWFRLGGHGPSSSAVPAVRHAIMTACLRAGQAAINF